MRVIHDDIIIANAFYAKQAGFLNYEDIRDYRILFFQTLTQKHKGFTFKDSNKNTLAFEINGKYFQKDEKGIQCFSELDEEYINELNSSFKDKEIMDMIKETHEIYANAEEPFVKKRELAN